MELGISWVAKPEYRIRFEIWSHSGPQIWKNENNEFGFEKFNKVS